MYCLYESKRKFSTMEFSFKNGEYTLTYKDYRSPATGYSKVVMYQSTNQDNIFLKLENGEIIKNAGINYGSTRYETASDFGNWLSMGYSRKNMYVFEPMYEFKKSDFEKLAKNKVIKVRIECRGTLTETNTPVENIEFNVEPDIQDSIVNNAKCIILGDNSSIESIVKENNSAEKPYGISNYSLPELMNLLADGKWDVVENEINGKKEKPAFAIALKFYSDYRYDLIASFGYSGKYELSSDNIWITFIPENKSITKTTCKIELINENEFIISYNGQLTRHKKSK
ncbi:MAG: hypothetical protein IPJ66_10150 [Bacteroidetes bacterium]|nr:hypothetical protein [Bacteroidota bacterium]